MIRIIVFVIACLTSLLEVNISQAQTPDFYGQVLQYNPNPYGQHWPYPHLQVILIHRTSGPSSPRWTDLNGFYYFARLPNCYDEYLMEIYNQRTLVYRQVIPVNGCPFALRPILIR